MFTLYSLRIIYDILNKKKKLFTGNLSSLA